MFKWLHAEHHSSRKDMHALHGMRFHPLDLIIENTSGPLIAIAFWWIFGYSEVHVASASFYFLVRGGLLDHSANIHTMVVGVVPFHDMIFKYTLAHNIHHAQPKTHMTLIPFHHIFPERRAADYELYHKLLPLEEEFNYDKGFDRGPVHIIASM